MDTVEDKKKPRIPRRFKYTEYYATETRTDISGKTFDVAVYTGPCMKPCHSYGEYKYCRVVLILCAIVYTVSLVLVLGISGFSVYSGGEYVLVPAAAGLITALYCILGAIKLPKSDRSLQKDIYELGHQRMLRSAIAGIVLLCITAGLSSVFFVVSKITVKRIDILFFACIAAGIVACVWVSATIKKLKYEE